MVSGSTTAVGDNIRIRRAARRWSQERLSKEAKVEQKTISNIERTHRYRSDSIEKIARALGCSVADLVRSDTDIPAGEDRCSSDSTAARKGKQSSRSQRGSAA